MLLSLDVSSTCAGWALFQESSPAKVESFGIIKPPQRWEPNLRIAEMAKQALSLVKLSKVRVVLIEDTPGKMGRGAAGGGAGIDTYGKAVGFIWAAIRHCHPIRIDLISPRTWTRGIPKPKRQMWVAAKYAEHGYRTNEDGGGDVADALAMAEWWFMEQLSKRASMTPEGT